MCCAAMEGTAESTVRARRVCYASRCGGAAGRPRKRTAPQCCSHGPPRRSPPTSATALTTTASCVSAARRSHSRGRSWPCRGQTPRCTVTARTRGRSATSRWLPASRRAAAAATPRAGNCSPTCWRLQPRVLETAATPCTQLATPRISGGAALALRTPRAARDACDGQLPRAELPLRPPDRRGGVQQEWLCMGRPWQQPHARLRSDGAGEHPHSKPAAAPGGGLSQRCLRMRVNRTHPRCHPCCHPRCHPCHLPLPPRPPSPFYPSPFTYSPF